MYRMQAFRRLLLLTFILSTALAWPTAGGAANKGPGDSEPKRSYGSVEVILYQTSW